MPPPASTANPCYAVIFSSTRTSADAPGYTETARRMDELARSMPGFLDIESQRGPDGTGITISYWRSLDDIRRWREHPEHQAAQARGREVWYHAYRVRVCRVESDWEFQTAPPA